MRVLNSGENSAPSSSDVTAAFPVVFVFFTLLVGKVVAVILNRSGNYEKYLPPFTVSVFLIGCGLSIGERRINGNAGDSSGDSLLSSINLAGTVDPAVILYAFLPPLLFGEAMTLNFFQAKKAIASCLLLAFPVAVLGAYMLGQFIYWWVPNVWSFRLSFTAGAILASTDPVSVVAALSEIAKASPSALKLVYLITGESLLNDGSALVLFEALVEPEYDTVYAVTMYFVKVIFISPLVGAAIGHATVLALTYLNRKVNSEDGTLQMTLTITSAYLTFFIGQYLLKVSGPIACVVGGVILSSLAPPLYLQPEAIHIVWETLAWCANTVIFFLTGTIAGRYLLLSSKKEFLCMFMVYVGMVGIRTLIMVGLLPVLKFLNPGLTLKDALFASWAGLRGAISLAILLTLQGHVEVPRVDDHGAAHYDDGGHTVHEKKIVFPPEDIKDCFVTISGAVTFTILINGITAKPLYNFLFADKIKREVGAEAVIFHYVLKRIQKKANDTLKDLKKELPAFDGDTVMKLCEGVFGDMNLHLKPKHSGKRPSVSLTLTDDLPAMHNAKGQNAVKVQASTAKVVPGGADVSQALDTSAGGASVSSGAVGDSSRSTGRGHVEGETQLTRRGSNLAAAWEAAVGLSTVGRARSYVLSPHTYGGVERGLDAEIDKPLITKYRIVFYEILRRCYMRHIHEDRLPRGSRAALTLLNSIDIGLESVGTDGFDDWAAVQYNCTLIDRWKNVDAVNNGCMDDYCGAEDGCVRSQGFALCGALRVVHESNLDANKIYILTSFIDAHTYAEGHIALYLGEHEGISTPEEATVVRESAQAVTEAKKLLAGIDKETVSLHVTRQAARIVLRATDELVLHFCEEGILSGRDASHLFEVRAPSRAHPPLHTIRTHC